MNDFREYRGYCEATYGNIMHFGILGMHWGIRRYQNPDGSLTAAGKKRYNKYIDNPINKQFEDNIGKVSDKTIDAYDKENWHDADDSIVNLSKTEKIKDAIKKLPANYSTKDVEKLAKELSSGKFGTYIEKDKRASEHAIYEALKAKNEKIIEAQKQKIETANKIDLETVRRNIVSEEMMDKWKNAAEKDTYDLDFLEITQNDYDEMPEEAVRKQRLKDYGEYLNAYDTAKKTVNDKDFDGERGDEAADLTLKAYQKMGVDLEDMKPGDRNSRDWAKDSDQTIGAVRVADLCKTVKNKEEVMNILRSLDDNKFLRDIPGSKTALWELDWFYGSEIGGDYAKSHGSPGEKYIDAIFAILQAEGKLKHSAVDEIFEKFGII